jgi:hypothetical protein
MNLSCFGIFFIGMLLYVLLRRSLNVRGKQVSPAEEACRKVFGQVFTEFLTFSIGPRFVR